MVLDSNFSEFIGLLNAREARYLIVGGYAVAFHGHPRYTGDLDLWIERSPENARRVLDALGAFGFGALALTEADFTAPDRVVQLGYPPLRIDILTDLEGVTFSACYPRRDVATFDGLALPFLDLDSLKANKRAVGRPQDLADLDRLEREE